MLQLMLLRHAKASRDDPALADLDRPLTPRGRRNAAALGADMAAQGLAPDRILCSPARRTRDTLDILAAANPAWPVAQRLDALYDFGDGAAVLGLIRREAAQARALLVIGHNPSIAAVARFLAGDGERTLRRRLAEKYPTGTLAVIELAATAWPMIGEGQGSLVRFIRPKDLE